MLVGGAAADAIRGRGSAFCKGYNMNIEKILTNANGGTIVYRDQTGALKLYDFFAPKTVQEAKHDLQMKVWKDVKEGRNNKADPSIPPQPIPPKVYKPKPLPPAPEEPKVEEPDFLPYQPEGELNDAPVRRRGRPRKTEE